MAVAVAILISSSAFGRDRMAEALAATEWRPIVATPAQAELLVARHSPGIVVVGAPDADAEAAVACLRRLRDSFDGPRYLFVASVSSEELAIAAFHAGAHQYLKEPWTPQMFRASVAALLPATGQAAVVVQDRVSARDTLPSAGTRASARAWCREEPDRHMDPASFLDNRSDPASVVTAALDSARKVSRS